MNRLKSPGNLNADGHVGQIQVNRLRCAIYTRQSTVGAQVDASCATQAFLLWFYGGPGAPAAEAAMRRLIEIYHCQMETDDPYHHRVRPPLRQAVSRAGER